MGSFAVNCAISNLPIQYKDPVRLIALTQSSYGQDESDARIDSSDYRWVPRTPPLKATCNDCGNVKDVEEGLLRDTWLKALSFDLMEGTQDRRGLPSPTRQSLSFDALLNTLMCGGLWVKPLGGQIYVQHLRRLEQVERETLRSETGLQTQAIQSESVATLPETNPSEATTPLRVLPALIREDVWQAMLQIRLPRLSMARLIRQAKQRPLFPHGNLGQMGPSVHLDILWREARDLRVPVEAAHRVAELWYIDSLLSHLRFVWRPSHAAGPQQDNMFMILHAQFHSMLSSLACTKPRRRRST